MQTKLFLLTLCVLSAPLVLRAQTNAPARPGAFALANATTSPSGGPPETAAADFYFSGGSRRQFLQAVDKFYSVDWSSVADFPKDQASFRIPALRLQADRQRNSSSAAGETNGPLETLVATYNLLSQDRPELGQLTVMGPLARPITVTFKPAVLPANPATAPKLKAYPLKGIPITDWEKLANTAEAEAQKLMAAQRQVAADPARARTQDGWDTRQITIHQDTGLMIVIGPAAMLEIMDSILNAWQANQTAGEARPAPQIDAARK